MRHQLPDVLVGDGFTVLNQSALSELLGEFVYACNDAFGYVKTMTPGNSASQYKYICEQEAWQDR